MVALVVPTPSGYLSVRFKPSALLFPVVKDLYRELKAIESGATRDGNRGAAMALAAEALQGALQKKGYATYDEFMYALLASEWASHQSLLTSKTTAGAPCGSDRAASELSHMLSDCLKIGSRFGQLFAAVENFLQIIKSMDGKAAFLRSLAANVHLVALNAVIGACAVEERGSGFSVVSENLAVTSQETHVIVDAMGQQLNAFSSSLREIAFNTTAAKIQVDTTIFVLSEILKGEAAMMNEFAAGRGESERDVETLIDSVSASGKRLKAAINEVRRCLPKLVALQRQLERHLRSLSVVRVVGKVHATGLAEEIHFQELLDRILSQLDCAAKELGELTMGIDDPRFQLPALEASATTLNGEVEALNCLIPGHGLAAAS